MMKVIPTENSVESLFWELMKEQKRFKIGGLRLLSVLLESDRTPFMKQYIKLCKSFTLHTFLSIRYQVILDKSLNLSKILSPDCIAASKVNFSEFESRYIGFLENKGITVIESKSFKPSQWSIGNFHSFVREADFLGTRIDWSSWCGDSDLTGEHFNAEFWDSSDRLWRLLNYKCIQKLTENRRIFLRARFPSIFKVNSEDSPRSTLMKIVTLGATNLAFKEIHRHYPQEHAIIKENINSLLRQTLIIYKTDPSAISVPWTAAKIIKICEIRPEILNLSAHSTKQSLLEVYRLLKDFHLVTSSWLLNLIYIFTRDPNRFTAADKIIDWFFELNPSTQNICQLLEILGIKKNLELKESVLLRFGLDQISQIHKECPKYCNSLLVPIEARMKTVLQRKRIFMGQVLKFNVPVSEKDHFWVLLKLIYKFEPTILLHNYAKFEKGFGSMPFHSLDRFLEHFLETFLKYPALYILISIESDGKPVIIPSLIVPEKLTRLLFSIIARSVILGFSVPFHIHYDYFYAGFSYIEYDQLPRILKIKRLYYKNRQLIDNSDVVECGRVNTHDVNGELLFEHVMKVCTQDPSPAKVSEPTFLRSIKLQLQAVNKGIYKAFPPDVIFEAKEMYLLLFKRQ